MIQRGGEVVIRMLENVQQRTIEPLIKATIALGTILHSAGYLGQKIIFTGCCAKKLQN